MIESIWFWSLMVILVWAGAEIAIDFNCKNEPAGRLGGLIFLGYGVMGIILRLI